MPEKSPIPRLKCVVDTCTYYDKGDHCTATEIEIRPPAASSVKETDCGTFQLK